MNCKSDVMDINYEPLLTLTELVRAQIFKLFPHAARCILESLH